MILIGQYDSSFVRRVAIPMRLYGIPFEHRPWSVFGDREQIRMFNPLMRVPTLVLDDGEVLYDMQSIMDYVDARAPAGVRLMPADGEARRKVLQVMALATGLADKGVTLFYELRLHTVPSEKFVERCRTQIAGVLAALESARKARAGEYWFGQLTHADIAAATAWRHVSEAHPGLIEPRDYPALAAHCATLEAMPVFQEIVQPFDAPGT